MNILILKLVKCSPILILILMEIIECAPYDHMESNRKLTYIYRFGSIYNKENLTQLEDPLFQRMFHHQNREKNVTHKSKSEFNPPRQQLSSPNRENLKSKSENKKLVIDDHILFKVFNEDKDVNEKLNNVQESVTVSSVDLEEDAHSTMDTTYETTTTIADDDYRFSGGLAAQHAVISLIGR